MAQVPPMPNAMRPPVPGQPGQPGPGQGMPIRPGMIPPGMGPPMQIPVNPAMQSLLDSLPHTPVPFLLANVTMPNTTPPQQNLIAVCPEHKQSICEVCGVDFNGLNYMHQFLRQAPDEAIPPPPNVQPPPQRAEMIKNMKEQGNTAFKDQKFGVAIQHYSKSADMALSRAPWEQSAVGRDETAIALCNRSAAFAIAGAWQNALADAEAVVTLKRPWGKGHFRKARALLGLERLEEARQAIIDGLQFEPNDEELNKVLKEIDEKILEADEA